MSKTRWEDGMVKNEEFWRVARQIEDALVFTDADRRRVVGNEDDPLGEVRIDFEVEDDPYTLLLLQRDTRPRQSLDVVLAALYLSEINCTLVSFWDGGWDVKLGDDMNGYVDETGFAPKWVHGTPDQGVVTLIAEWLSEQAVKHYPKSAYAYSVKHGHWPSPEELTVWQA